MKNNTIKMNHQIMNFDTVEGEKVVIREEAWAEGQRLSPIRSKTTMVESVEEKAEARWKWGT